MMKTLFLHPPSFDGFDGGAGSRYQAKREIRSFWYPTWLAQPAALVPGSKLIDAPPARLRLEDVLPLAGDYELAVLHTSTPSFAADVKVAEALKETNPRLKIGLIGAKVAVEPEASLAASRAVGGSAAINGGTKAMTLSARGCESVISHAGDSWPCSACPTRSEATIVGSADARGSSTGFPREVASTKIFIIIGISRSTSHEPKKYEGSSASRPRRRSSSANPSAVCATAHRVVIFPAASNTHTACVSAAQSIPT